MKTAVNSDFKEKTVHSIVSPQVEHVKFVDFCGKYKVPLMQYLCSSTCKADRPAVTASASASAGASAGAHAVADKMKRVLLG